MEKRLTMILASLFLCVGMALAQTSVTGTVVSQEDGLPVVGATVRVEGSNSGTVTDVDGKFSVNAPADAYLTVTYIGMKETRVKAGRNMRIVLESDDNALDELVVTGYGSARKLGTIAGSVATVSSDKIADRPVANVGDALQGQVAGLQVFTSSGEPSATTSMRIRGVTSIYATTEPLFILDGSEISQNTFLSLNPNDIENITVLKDASSTAIYGSRAANGVVVITSKKGDFGEAPTVTISAQYGISQLAADRMEMMNANQWLGLQEMLDPSLASNANFQAQREFYRVNGINTDWTDKLFGDNKPTSQIDLSIRGGSNNLSYLLSYGHYNAEGIMDDSEMRRETLRANLELNVTPWLKVGSNTNLAYTKTKTTAYSSMDGFSLQNKSMAARGLLPTNPYYEILGLAYNADGSVDWTNSTFEGYGDRMDQLMDGNYNPYYWTSFQPSHNTRVRINENAFVNINPIKGLNIRSAVGLDWNDYRVSQKCYRVPEVSFAQVGIVSETYSRYYRWTVTNTIEYKFDFLRDHHVSILAGQESMNNKSDAFGAFADGFMDNRLLILSSAPMTEDHIPQVSQSISEEVRNSWFGMLSYNYADRYFLDASIRRDGSSLFAEDHRWGTFGAVAAMWNITNEKFMAPTKSWLNDLQLRVSYGSTGNSGIDPYMFLGLVGSTPSYGSGTGTAIANASNPNLSWETVKTFNVGLSGKVFNRLTFGFEFYNKVTSDMLMQIPYSYTTGFSSGWGNVGEMYNRGIDINLSADIIKTKDWYWNVNLNINYNKNEVTKLFNDVESYDVTNLVHLEEGHPYGEFYQVRWSHVDPADGQTVWLDKNGNETKIYSEDNRVMTGMNMIAPWSGGLSTTLSWKGLQLDMQFTGMFDRYLMNNEKYFLENPSFATKFNQTTNMLDMWQKPGDVTNIAAANCQRQFDTSLIENATFIRLKFLQLSYTFPQKWMDATHFLKGAKIYFVGRNLFTITPYNGYDPEIDSFVTFGDYPNTRQYSFGIQLTL